MIIYSDESYSNNQRFYCITGVSGKKVILDKLSEKIQAILDKYGISEIKYSKMSNLNRYFTPFQEIIDIMVLYLINKQIRIDSIVRDRLDSRHQIESVKHERNFERMYYHLLKIIVKKHNNPKLNWSCCVDEKKGCRWLEIEKYLRLTKSLKYPDLIRKGLFESVDSITGKEKIKIVLQEEKSCNIPLIQVADLFAGFICFSKQNYETYSERGLHFYERWTNRNKHNDSTKSLFLIEESLLFYQKIKAIECGISNNDKKRYYAKEYIVNRFKINQLGLSLNTNQFIASNNGLKGFYILHYEPQSIYDKAPTK